ncbi:MAG: retinol dehydrogenase 12 [SAR86 cluster bacterium SAR86A]|uniref:Probable oxidoreductase n=1 Tax=SAR86 cluster bacterium SAR86A TaxID=1123866 RepID=J5KAX7_9GAMM|nr:MAG: retinol dehydrogenase 12 [SAR86 cluster bacterium SAR86A]
MISKHQTPTKSGFHSKTNANEITNGIDLNEKIAIVTGGYSGIGLETTRELVATGAKVIIPAKRTEVAVQNLEGIVSKENIVEMDLGNLNSVKKFTEDFKESFGKLDLLINNAGIMACPETRIGNGWESQFAVNHIGHFLLTKELMDTMAENDSARFVSLSSSAHSLTGILWDDIHFQNNSYDKWMAYGQSKTASSLIAIEFHRRMVDKGVSGFSVHPGGILTPLQRHLQKEEMVALGWMDEDGSPSEMAKNFFKTTSQGASTTLWCATSSSLNGIGGVFCEDCDIAKRKNEVDESIQRYFGVADWAVDTEEASKLWDVTEKMLAS